MTLNTTEMGLHRCKERRQFKVCLVTGVVYQAMVMQLCSNFHREEEQHDSFHGCGSL